MQSVGNPPLKLEFDDRREVWRLLARLDRRERLEFLIWACRKVSKPGYETRVTESSGDVEDVFADVQLLAYQFGIGLTEMGEYLVKMVRRLGK